MSILPELSEDAAALIQLVAMLCGGVGALLLFSLAVWTWRDISARTRDGLARLLSLALVVGLNVVGLVVYLLLRPRETIAERYERRLIEEILAREVSAGALGRRRAAGSEPGAG